jgi:hypothetical protein
MSYKKIAFLLSVACLVCLAPAAHAQEEEESVRQVFFATRPSGSSGTAKKSPTTSSAATNRTNTGKSSKATGKSTPKSTGAKKPSGGTTAGTKTATGNSSSGASVSTSGATSKTNSGGATPTRDSIALGYTLYMRDEDGNAMRAEPSKEFTAGDRIRVALEANTDGYLYIFHSENGRDPQMLFPDVRLNRGSNIVRAHVPYQVPANLGDWFLFDANPATERLYIVLTRQPLANVPVGDELLKHTRIQSADQSSTQQISDYCRANAESCIWRPTPAVWEQLTSAAKAPVLTNKEADAGRAQTNVEREATTRGIGLSQDDPAPSVIRMSHSSNTGMLVTMIDLVHK